MTGQGTKEGEEEELLGCSGLGYFPPLSLAQQPEPTTTPLIADLGGPLVGVGG
jgi:hypothetical protein